MELPNCNFTILDFRLQKYYILTLFDLQTVLYTLIHLQNIKICNEKKAADTNLIQF
jgi:hypothetical protein